MQWVPVQLLPIQWPNHKQLGPLLEPGPLQSLLTVTASATDFQPSSASSSYVLAISVLVSHALGSNALSSLATVTAQATGYIVSMSCGFTCILFPPAWVNCIGLIWLTPPALTSPVLASAALTSTALALQHWLKLHCLQLRWLLLHNLHLRCLPVQWLPCSCNGLICLSFYWHSPATG
jgi:hypothetical protein